MVKKIIAADPWLEPYADKLQARAAHVQRESTRILGGKTSAEFALGHLYFGLHRTANGWVLREWAPHATKMYLVGECNDWRDNEHFAFTRTGDAWELALPQATLRHEMKYKLHVYWDGGDGHRIPAYATRVVQDDTTKLFDAQVWHPRRAFRWTDGDFAPDSPPVMIYEAHVGMSSEAEEVATYRYFTDRVLPRIKKAGYDTVQLMAVAEHPYYGSFGYHVANFFAPSSRFGTPEDLKRLVNTAHGMGLRVIMDLVHSHSVKNEQEGLSNFAGDTAQYFHAGARGNHEQWDSRTFDYGKPEVAHFLLSNCRYWLDEFHIDGYRFDGVTSMLYYHHGLGKAFASYDDYFDATDNDALAYLTLANEVIHQVKPSAVTIAEDMSALPGLALPSASGGVGFDYRLSMGIADKWIKLLKHSKDEDWDLGGLLYDLTAHRPEEQTISYAESHDQALVGDKTIAFRLMDKEMYWHMNADDDDLSIERGVALHKIIRLLTASTHSGGYLNFMGNEFGHPEWVDFPREGNDWSYAYARRQWSLVDSEKLKYRWLAAFDAAMIAIVKQLHSPIEYTYVHQADHVLSFVRDGYVVAVNLSPNDSYQDYGIPVSQGNYKMILSLDDETYGGQGRVDTMLDYPAVGGQIKLYLPARTAVVLRLDGQVRR